jgi:hypothetical protein
MASVAFDLFLPEVLLEAPGIPTPVAINAVRNACFDFCRDSLWLNNVLDPEAYTAGTASYELAAPSGAQVVSVLSVTLDNSRTVYPWSLEDVVVNRPNWQVATGVIDGFVQPSPETITFIPIPQSDGVFTASVAIAPTRAATSVDARVYNHHLESIKYGALWKIKSQTGQPWADPAGASLNEQRFLMMVGQATIDRFKSNSRASMRVAPRPFV